MKIYNHISFRMTLAASLVLAGAIVAASQGQSAAAEEREAVHTDRGTMRVSGTNAETHDNTLLYDAVYLGIEKLMRSAYQKRAIILISDGEDNDSRYSFNELRRSLKESDVIIYAIGVSRNFLPRKGALNGGETL